MYARERGCGRTWLFSGMGIIMAPTTKPNCWIPANLHANRVDRKGAVFECNLGFGDFEFPSSPGWPRAQGTGGPRRRALPEAQRRGSTMAILPPAATEPRRVSYRDGTGSMSLVLVKHTCARTQKRYLGTCAASINCNPFTYGRSLFDSAAGE